MNKKYISIALSVGVVTGGATGYLVAKALLTRKYQKIADEEILSVKKQYGMVFEREDFDGTDEEFAKADRQRTHEYLERLDNLGYAEDAPTEEEPLRNGRPEKVELGPIVEEAPEEPLDDNGFDQKYPYPIKAAEYFQDEQDYEKLTLTWYKGDDTLADGQDEPIHEFQKLIGTCHYKFMGYDPVEPHVVYVRNHKMKCDFEVCLDEDAFITAVHGIATETLQEKID